MMSGVRVRFAPSPTGPLHIGGVRTALYNYLFAKRNNGKFIIRIEDTDQARYVEGAEEYIYEALTWVGITPDESAKVGGEYAPYRQSERKDKYREHVLQLIEKGHAYYAFDTPEELEEMRISLEQAGVVKPQYNSITRRKMKNSLTLSSEEVNEKLNQGEPYVIRLKVPEKEDIRFKDAIRSWVVVHSSTIDDKVLMKSDGMPTYHLANVVDDHLMKITHVIRGEEWLPSAPLHVLLYKFFGWEDEMPEFAHLPLILKPEGKGKLSKRDAEKHGFPLFPIEWNHKENNELFAGFREEGYLPEALINFLAFLGWNPGGEEELMNMSQLIEKFSLERINKAGARFDIAKAQWFNANYLRQKDTDTITSWVKKYALEAGESCDDKTAEKIGQMMKDRVSFPGELFSTGKYFFHSPEEYDEKVVRKKWDEEVSSVFQLFSDSLKNTPHLSSEEVKNTLNTILEKQNTGMGKVMQILRVAITGVAGGPDLMEIISVLGGNETAERIDKAIETFS
ncbi:MAG: glutamate--tRNA ligase, partial [Cyclobacteriaceae bacterium]|nr:glutamate--tRNA ligase [Cyclobacteriaceae bacterium]